MPWYYILTLIFFEVTLKTSIRLNYNFKGYVNDRKSENVCNITFYIVIRIKMLKKQI